MFVPWLTRGEPTARIKLSREAAKYVVPHRPIGSSYSMWGALDDSFFLEGASSWALVYEQFWSFLPRQSDT